MRPIKLYDVSLKGLSGISWSPNTCKIRYALTLKNIPYETVWIRLSQIYSEVPKVMMSTDHPTVPIIRDENNDRSVQDSWKIVKYLENNYPDSPKLLAGNEALNYLFYQYCEDELYDPLFRLSCLEIWKNAGSRGVQNAFRSIREEKYKMTLEDVHEDWPKHVKQATKALEPIRKTLSEYRYLSGDKVGWSDIVVASYLHTADVLRNDIFTSHILNGVDNNERFCSWYKGMNTYLKPDTPKL
ncbi:hypothetical protein CLU79DRAFT_722618 [Phycomyces nitens]|nr:hypothetical protein CLU79DRAFT_722618 [Phycomyces nitens]